MSQFQILPTLPRVEDSIADVALTLYTCPELAFNLEGWQEGTQHRLPPLLPHSPPSAAATTSTDIC